MTTVQDLMDRASAMIRDDPDKARKFGGVCKFALSGEGGRTFIVDLTDDPRVIDGDGDAQCTISMGYPISSTWSRAERTRVDCSSSESFASRAIGSSP